MRVFSLYALLPGTVIQHHDVLGVNKSKTIKGIDKLAIGDTKKADAVMTSAASVS